MITKEERQQRFETLKALFPEFTLEYPDGAQCARLKRKTYIAPVNLEDADKGYDYLFSEWLDYKILESYKRRWPYLHIQVDQSKLHLWVIHPSYPDSGHTAISFEPHYPLLPEEAETLNTLNIQAQKYVESVRDKDVMNMFFCTNCKKALPHEKYVAYWFATVLCKDCATPEFIKRAKEETYN